MTDPPPEPGWYPDPEDPQLTRYWDGGGWTDRRQPYPAGPIGRPTGMQPMFGPAPGGATLPPPKRGMSTGAKVILWIFGVFAVIAVLAIGGCVACGALFIDAVDNELGDRDFGEVDVGETLEMRDVRYTVTQVDTPRRIGSGATEQRASGRFVVLTVTVRGGRSLVSDVSASDFRLETKDGRRIRYDSRAQSALGAPFGSLSSRLEGGDIAFDVPEPEISGARVRIEAPLGNGHGYVVLGR